MSQAEFTDPEPAGYRFALCLTAVVVICTVATLMQKDLPPALVSAFLVLTGGAGFLAAMSTRRRPADDLEEHRRLRARVERLTSSDVVPVVMTDLEGRCVEASTAFRELVGAAPGDPPLEGMRWEALALPADRELDERAASQARAHGAAPSYERTLVCPDGRRIPVLVGALTAVPEESTLLWFVVDLSSRTRLQEERAALLRERGRAEADSVRHAKDEFLSVLSHELRAPLQGVLGWVSLLQEGRLDSAQQTRAHDAIERCARRQMQLINDLLDVSRIVAGTFRLEFHPVELAGVVRNLVEQSRPLASLRGIAFEAYLSDCGVTLGDPDRLHQALANLVSNALKFTPAGGTIAVRCEKCGDHLVVIVRDTGEGIGAQFLPYVFEHLATPRWPRPRSRDRAQAGRAARRHHRGGQSGPRSRRDLHHPAAGARARWRRSGLGQRRRRASSASLTCWVAWNCELKT
jgi:PAS domain S-box-containing protein